MARYIDADLAPFYLNKEGCKMINRIPTEDVQEVKHGKWIFHERTRLVSTNKVGIKEEYLSNQDCTTVNDKNVNQKIMIIKKRITVRKPMCSLCGWVEDDESGAMPYCPNCGALMLNG